MHHFPFRIQRCCTSEIGTVLERTQNWAYVKFDEEEKRLRRQLKLATLKGSSADDKARALEWLVRRFLTVLALNNVYPTEHWEHCEQLAEFASASA